MTQKTLITLLLDTTYSMKKHVTSTISGLNEYVGSLQEQDMDARLSLVTFNAAADGGLSLRSPIAAAPLSGIRPFVEADMPCEGNTPLLAAIKFTIDEVERTLGARRNVKPILVIQTDGEENVSHLVTYQDSSGQQKRGVSYEEVRTLIRSKEAAGWEFVFMGCGIDAYQDGMKLGLNTDKIMSYAAAHNTTQNAFRATADATKSYLRGDAVTMSYSVQHKTESGDAYAEGRN